MKLIISGLEIDLYSVDELTMRVAYLKDFEEISLTRNDASSLIILLHPKCGFMRYLRFPEDSGFMTWDEKSKLKEREFMLENDDKLSVKSERLVLREKAIEALHYFYKTGHMMPGISWKTS